jgi:hypothetical protein
MSTSKKNILDTCQPLRSAERLLLLNARVVEWQTRTFEGRMPKGLRVQVPPRAFPFLPMKNEVFWLPYPRV